MINIFFTSYDAGSADISPSQLSDSIAAIKINRNDTDKWQQWNK